MSIGGKDDIDLAKGVSLGDNNACAVFVNDYTDLVLSKVWNLAKTHCSRPAKEKICSLLIIQRQRKGPAHLPEDQCDECMDSYIWFFDFLKNKVKSYKGTNNCSKSRALIDMLASNRDFAAGEKETQATAMLKELDTIEAEDKAMDVSSRAPDMIVQRKTRSIEIKEKIKTMAPELHSLVTISVPPPAEIQAYIGSDETVLEYYYSGDDLYAFVLTKDSLKAVKLDGLDLIQDVEFLRKSLEAPASRLYVELCRNLYQRLIKPVEHLLNKQQLVIVPHGILHYVPFYALHNGRDYLIDHYSISYLPSLSVKEFIVQRKARKETQQALVIGNPDLGDPQYDLKYAEEEAVAIAKGFSRPTVLLRKEATETNFKKIGGRFDYIHLATHGIFESGSPLNSGLSLVKDSENDGLLTVNELYSLHLNASLVTLSACETALGKINFGDDVVGLTRGFLYAGSSSIVASVWKVDDISTSELMREFYSNLGSTNKRDALREAQLAVKKRYEHPYFWAAFQLTGLAE